MLAYYNLYTRNTQYLVWQHRHATDNYNLFSEMQGQPLTLQFFTVDADGAATATPFLTHTVGQKHWLHWPSHDDTADGREALNLAQANAARLDALDAQVDGSAMPIHTQAYDENTALVAPLAGNAGDYAVSQAFANIEPDDLLVIDWKRCEHLNDHSEHVVPGSDTDAGRMYFYPRNFDSSEWNGEFLYALDRAVQNDGSADTLNSWIVAAIEYAGSTLTFGLHLQQGGTRANRNLKPQPGFSVSLRIFRNANIQVATEGSLHALLQALLARLDGLSFDHLTDAQFAALTAKDADTVYFTTETYVMAISLQVVSETEIKVLNNDTISVVARLLYVLVNGQEPFIPQLSSDPAGVVTVSFSETGIAGRQKFVAGDTFELVTTRTDVETPVLGAVVDQTAPIALTAEDLAPVKTVNKQTSDLPLGNALAINTTRGWTNINAPMDGEPAPRSKWKRAAGEPVLPERRAHLHEYVVRLEQCFRDQRRDRYNRQRGDVFLRFEGRGQGRALRMDAFKRRRSGGIVRGAGYRNGGASVRPGRAAGGRGGGAARIEGRGG